MCVLRSNLINPILQTLFFSVLFLFYSFLVIHKVYMIPIKTYPRGSPTQSSSLTRCPSPIRLNHLRKFQTNQSNPEKNPTAHLDNASYTVTTGERAPESSCENSNLTIDCTTKSVQHCIEDVITNHQNI